MLCLGLRGYFVACFCLVNLDRSLFLKEAGLCHTQIWSRFSLRLRLAFSCTCERGRISDAGGERSHIPTLPPPGLWEAQGIVTVLCWVAPVLWKGKDAF